MELNLSRSIVFFDLETTGLQVGHDHIVQMCLYKVNPDHTEEELTLLVRPCDDAGLTVHIPEETTRVHGITDEMVAHEPSFKELAERLLTFIGDADLAGYNSNKFDVPMLVEEFLRAGYPFSVDGRHCIDVQNIFHKMEQRTLKAAYRFYCGKRLENAHSADADTKATYEVLKAQLDRYDGVEYEDAEGCVSVPVVNNMEALAAFTKARPIADLVGHIGFDANMKEVFLFGKHKDRRLYKVFAEEPAYFTWMMNADFPRSTKVVIERVFREVEADKRRRKEENRRRVEEGLNQLQLKFNNPEKH